MGTIAVSGGVPPENALDALLDELQTFAKPLNQINDLRPDDSTSDDSSQAIHSTVTTQLSQASLYTPNDPNAPQQQQQFQQQHQQLPLQVFNSNTLPTNNKTNNSNYINNNNNMNTLHVNSNIGSLRRLHSYPSGSDTDTSPPQPSRPLGKPPVPERNADLLSKVNNKRVPPPPPPRTSSRSPLASPTSPNIPLRLPSLCETDVTICGNGGGSGGGSNGSGQDGSGNSSGNESGNDHVQRQVALEMRHQELLKKQKMLQEQYARLQKMSKNPVSMQPPLQTDIMQLKKTGSESNLPQKMGLNMAPVTGSMRNLNTEMSTVANSTALVSEKNEKNLANSNSVQQVKQQLMAEAALVVATANGSGTGEGCVGGGGGGGGRDGGSSGATHGKKTVVGTTTNKVYETEIL